MVWSRQFRRGFSMVETLVVLAIMMVLFTLLVPTLTRAVRMAKRTAEGQEMRSEHVGDIAQAIHERPLRLTPQETISVARSNFRFEDEPGRKKFITRLLYTVRNDQEFRAYWHTLLNPNNTALPELTRGGELVAFKPEGQRFELLPVHGGTHVPGPAYLVKWDFISTRLAETGRGEVGGNVVYSDGRVVYVPYPQKFPMTRQVAELSHRFYMEVIP